MSIDIDQECRFASLKRVRQRYWVPCMGLMQVIFHRAGDQKRVSVLGTKSTRPFFPRDQQTDLDGLAVPIQKPAQATICGSIGPSCCLMIANKYPVFHKEVARQI